MTETTENGRALVLGSRAAEIDLAGGLREDVPTPASATMCPISARAGHEGLRFRFDAGLRRARCDLRFRAQRDPRQVPRQPGRELGANPVISCSPSWRVIRI